MGMCKKCVWWPGRPRSKIQLRKSSTSFGWRCEFVQHSRQPSSSLGRTSIGYIGTGTIGSTGTIGTGQCFFFSRPWFTTGQRSRSKTRNNRCKVHGGSGGVQNKQPNVKQQHVACCLYFYGRRPRSTTPWFGSMLGLSRNGIGRRYCIAKCHGPCDVPHGQSDEYCYHR